MIIRRGCVEIYRISDIIHCDFWSVIKIKTIWHPSYFFPRFSPIIIPFKGRMNVFFRKLKTWTNHYGFSYVRRRTKQEHTYWLFIRLAVEKSKKTVKSLRPSHPSSRSSRVSDRFRRFLTIRFVSVRATVVSHAVSGPKFRLSALHILRTCARPAAAALFSPSTDVPALWNNRPSSWSYVPPPRWLHAIQTLLVPFRFVSFNMTSGSRSRLVRDTRFRRTFHFDSKTVRNCAGAAVAISMAVGGFQTTGSRVRWTKRHAVRITTGKQKREQRLTRPSHPKLIYTRPNASSVRP